MKYTTKWIEDHLGISSDTIRYYEKIGLLICPRNPKNEYREYTEDYLISLWTIKLLCGIGYSLEEIGKIKDNRQFDFFSSLTTKIGELEKKVDETAKSLEFAKTLKLTGRFPTISEYGNSHFDDLVNYCRENYNLFRNPTFSPLAKMTDLIYSNKLSEINDTAFDQLADALQRVAPMAYTLHGYYRVIASMSDLSYKSDVVQRIVRLIHECIERWDVLAEIKDKITPRSLARYLLPNLSEGDVGITFKQNYGEIESEFIADAIAYYGGYENAKSVK